MTIAAVLVGYTGEAQTEKTPDAEPSAAEGTVSRRRLSTVTSLGMYLGIGTIWYVLDPVNARDREYDWSFKTLKQKFVTRDALRFDDNTFGVNTPGHASAGALYYLSARSHGAGKVEAFVAGFAGSTAWEMAVEFREVLSLNDAIITPVGGFALGESLHQVGEFFRRSEPVLRNQFLGAVLMGPTRLLPWTERPSPARRPFDGDGYPTDMWGRIHIGVGAELSGASMRPVGRTAALLDAKARIVDIPGYGRPGVADPTWFASALLAELHVRLIASPSGFEGFWLSGEAIWSGLYGRRLYETGDGLRGVDWLAGLSAIYDNHQLSVAGGGDRLEAVSPIGASGHVAVHLGPSRLRIDASLYPVFAGVHNHAWTGIGAGVNAEAPDVLARDGYYFAVGARAAGAVGLEWGGWRVQAAARAYALSSAEWMEVPPRASHMVLTDQRLSWEASIDRSVVRSIFAKIALQNDAHWSRVEDVFAEGGRQSVALQLIHEL